MYKMWGYGGQFVFVVPDQELVAVLTSDTKKEHPDLDGDSFFFRYVLPAITTEDEGIELGK